MGGHKVYSFRSDQFCSANKIAFVLSVLIINNDNYFTVPDIFQGLLDAVELNPAAVDGSQNAAGIMMAACGASAGEVKGVAFVRNVYIIPDNLVWPVGITETQKSIALAQLDAKGIVACEEA